MAQITQLRVFGGGGQVRDDFFQHSSNPSGSSSGLPGRGDRVLEEFQWCDPVSLEDGRAGRVIDGVWWPDSMIVTVDGKEYGRPFAPDPQNPNPLGAILK